MSELVVHHQLTLAEALARFESLATKHDIALEPQAQGCTGRATKSLGFLGQASARYEFAGQTLRLCVEQSPPLLGEQTLRGMLERELATVFGTGVG